jgi:hypothetical protein
MQSLQLLAVAAADQGPRHCPPAVVAFAVVLVFFIAVLLGWVLPVLLGVCAAKRKNYSPRWMWFGIHPVLGWIACIVLLCLTPRVQCPNCGGYVMNYWRICPCCHVRFGEEKSATSPSPPSP